MAPASSSSSSAIVNKTGVNQKKSQRAAARRGRLSGGTHEGVGARERRGVQCRGVHHMECERYLGVRVPRQVLPEAVDELRNQRIVHHLGLTLDFLSPPPAKQIGRA